MAEKKKLGEMLIEAYLIDKLQLDSALGHQRNWGGRLGSILIDLGFINETELAGFIEKQLNLPCLDVTSLHINKAVIDLVKIEIAKKYTVFPINIEGNALTLAMVDPTDLGIIDELQFITGKRIVPALALESEIKRAIRKYYEREDIEGSHYRVEHKKVDIKEESHVIKVRPEERVLEEKDFKNEKIEKKEIQKEGPEIEVTKKEEKKEIPQKVIVEALTSLLIEKGIIKREDLLEKIEKQLRK